MIRPAGTHGSLRDGAFAVALVVALGFAPQLAAQMSELPAELHGLWAAEPEHCVDPSSDGRLQITARTATFFASHFDVRSVSRNDSGWIAEADVHEEGEEGTEPGRLTLRLVAADTLDAAIDAEPALRYVRCAQAAPAR